jgi:hypothetical protein
MLKIAVLAPIPRASVSVETIVKVGCAPLQGHLQGTEREIAIIHGTELPADDEAGVEIEDRRGELLLAAEG